MTGRNDTDYQPASDRSAGDDQMVDLRLRVRRAPRFGRFILAGFVLGMIVGGLFDLLGPAGSLSGAVAYSDASGTAFLAAVCGLVGGVAGAIVAVLLDRRS